jgi:DNA-directed RNA polymerase subunit RPC12/RpoP
MASGGAFVGYECRDCGIRVGLTASVTVGGEAVPTCSNCGKRMTPVSGPGAPEMIANFECGRCGTRIGGLVSTGPITNCPNCGASIP